MYTLRLIYRKEKVLLSLNCKGIKWKDHEMFHNILEIISLTFQNSLSHLGLQLLIRYSTWHMKHGMNDNYCLGYKSVQISLRIQYQSTSHSKSIFKRKATPNIYVVLRGGNQMKGERVTLKSLCPSLVFPWEHWADFIRFNLILLWQQCITQIIL